MTASPLLDSMGCVLGVECTPDELCPAHGGKPMTKTEWDRHYLKVQEKAGTAPVREGNLGEVIDERVKVYGEPVEMFTRTAEIWSGILGHHVNATDVPLCLIGMKMVRTTQAPDYADNSDDIESYLDIFRKLVGDDMIEARSVTEYIEKKRAKLEAEKPGGVSWQ